MFGTHNQSPNDLEQVLEQQPMHRGMFQNKKQVVVAKSNIKFAKNSNFLEEVPFAEVEETEDQEVVKKKPISKIRDA
jgi:hypothetical protein